MTNLQTTSDELKEASERGTPQESAQPRPRKLRIVPHLISKLRVWFSLGIFRENAEAAFPLLCPQLSRRMCS